jgi:osmotically-inducible protein OsmY
MRKHSRQTGALLAGLGLGAALMYMLDPRRGARRRALVRDRASSTLRTGRREFRRRAEDLKHRAEGAVAELKGHLRERKNGTVDDDQLTERVRAELGHKVNHASALEVTARDGIVTLGGQIPREELPAALATVRKVRGVEQVRDELRVNQEGTGRET